MKKRKKEKRKKKKKEEKEEREDTIRVIIRNPEFRELSLIKESHDIPERQIQSSLSTASHSQSHWHRVGVHLSSF